MTSWIQLATAGEAGAGHGAQVAYDIQWAPDFDDGSDHPVETWQDHPVEPWVNHDLRNIKPSLTWLTIINDSGSSSLSILDD